jgi:uncharacterized protein YggT (Ycf19 family)
MYTLIGRLVLGLFVPDEWDNYIWRGFRMITDPVVAVVRAATPSLLGHPIVLIFAALWMMLARLVWYVALANLGLTPSVAGA